MFENDPEAVQRDRPDLCHKPAQSDHNQNFVTGSKKSCLNVIVSWHHHHGVNGHAGGGDDGAGADGAVALVIVFDGIDHCSMSQFDS